MDEEKLEKMKKLQEFNSHVEAIDDFCIDRKMSFEMAAKVFTLMIMKIITHVKPSARDRKDQFVSTLNEIFDKWEEHVNKANS